MPIPSGFARYRARARYQAYNPIARIGGDEAEEARGDLGIFGKYVCGKSPAAHHREWIEALVTGESNDSLNLIAGENTEILAPRGSAKSTWLSYFIAWVIGHNPGIQCIYLSYSEKIAISRSRIIRRIIESPLYQEVFPDIAKSSRWTDTLWEIDKPRAKISSIESDYTFYAVGCLGSIVSRRSNLIVCDDLIKSSQSILNRDIREQMVSNFYEAVLPTLIPGGRVIDIGTRFRRDDIHATEFTTEKGWNIVQQSAVNLNLQTGEETSFWEERFGIDYLQDLREKDPVSFSFQYQNLVKETGTESISYDWILRGDIPDIDQFESMTLGIDLASSLKDRSDYTAFVLTGRRNGFYYVIDNKFGKWVGNIDKFDIIKKMYKEWGEFEVLVENVAYQSSFISDFESYIEQEGITELRCSGVKLKGDKLQRLSGLKGLFQRGKIVFNKYRLMNRLIEEICNLGQATHDDGCDAFIYAMSGLLGRRSLDSQDFSE
jgi:predicted phage terminase large subunit-like protein